MHNLISDEIHQDAIESHHRYQHVQYKGVIWDLSHLNSFAMHVDPGLGFDVSVVVLFSCHCFSRALTVHESKEQMIFSQCLYDDGREIRILDESRYLLSRKFLPRIMRELIDRKIQVLPTANFLTIEMHRKNEEEKYAVFFDVKKDVRKKKRILLRVQSAYLLEKFSFRQQKAKKVGFYTLIRSVYDCRPIRA